MAIAQGRRPVSACGQTQKLPVQTDPADLDPPSPKTKRKDRKGLTFGSFRATDSGGAASISQIFLPVLFRERPAGHKLLFFCLHIPYKGKPARRCGDTSARGWSDRPDVRPARWLQQLPCRIGANQGAGVEPTTRLSKIFIRMVPQNGRRKAGSDGLLEIRFSAGSGLAWPRQVTPPGDMLVKTRSTQGQIVAATEGTQEFRDNLATMGRRGPPGQDAGKSFRGRLISNCRRCQMEGQSFVKTKGHVQLPGGKVDARLGKNLYGRFFVFGGPRCREISRAAKQTSI